MNIPHPYPTLDESCNRLRRASWSFGWVGDGFTWQVSGSNGENLLRAEGATRQEAVWKACEQARAVGMLAPAREEDPGRCP
jgi:hypothetical protein